MLKKLLFFALLIVCARTGFAQTAEETLAWLKAQVPLMVDNQTVHHFAFTDTHLEYHGSTYKNEVTDHRIVTFRWKDIRLISLGYAKVSTKLYIGGRGMEAYKDLLPENTDGASLPLAHWSSKLDPQKFYTMLRHMAELKGAVLEPERD